MVRDIKTSVGEQKPRYFGTQEEKLDRALVTGLMLEVVLETSTLPMDPQTLRHLVKTRLKDSLGDNLAGRVSLDRFRRLLTQVDVWFPLYYPLTTAGSPETPAPARLQAAPVAVAAALPARRALRVDRLRNWLEAEGRDLFPTGPTASSTRISSGSFSAAPRAAGSGSSTSPGTPVWIGKPLGNTCKIFSTPDCFATTGGALPRSATPWKPAFCWSGPRPLNRRSKRRCPAFPRAWRGRRPAGSSPLVARPYRKRVA